MITTTFLSVCREFLEFAFGLIYLSQIIFKLNGNVVVLAELYEQAIRYEKGSFFTSTGALATLSGAKTGRSPRDKRVVKDENTEKELWWGK